MASATVVYATAIRKLQVAHTTPSVAKRRDPFGPQAAVTTKGSGMCYRMA